MQDAAYNEAADPQPFRVFGLELLPLSIGHFILLSRHDSVFVRPDGGPITLEEVITAVLICSQPYQESKKTLRSKYLRWFVKYWGWRTRKLNIFQEIKRLQEYFEAQTKVPEILRSVSPSSNGSTGGLPWISVLQVFLMADLHMSPEESLDYSLLLAQWHFHAFLALRGNDQTLGDGLEEAIRIAKGELN